MKAREIVTEAPLTDRAMAALTQIKQAMNQPGEQVAQISVAPVPAAPGKDLATLQAEIRRLEKILAVANMIEQIAERIGRTRLGMDPGIEADLDIIRAWPVPKTDREMAEMLAKYENTLKQFKQFLAYKKKVWGRKDKFTEENLDEDWRKWVATGAMAASALTPMAAKAQSYQAPPRDATAAMQTMRRDDARVQQNQSQQQLAKVIYAQIVKQRGEPMDARQQQKWMTIAQEQAAAQMKTQQSSPAAKSGGSNLVQPSEYHRSRMMDKDW